MHVSLAALPGMRTVDAARTAIAGADGEGALDEPVFGRLSARHVQIVPQNYGIVDELLCDSLRDAFPGSRFRLHANARVLPALCPADLSSVDLYPDWFDQAARMSRRLDAQAYSAHSGSRRQASLGQVLENARRLADLFGCPVAIEGQYPSPGNHMLVSSWGEYREVFESGVPFVVDLSHLNILAARSGTTESSLVVEMLACERCIEIHVSANDGSGDHHRVCEQKEWWSDLLEAAHPNAVIFSEGNHRRRRAATNDGSAN